MLKKRYIILLLAVFAFSLSPNLHTSAAVQDEIAARNKQIAELQKQIADYQGQILITSSKAKTLANEISRLNALISKIQLEIKSLNLSIVQTDSEISSTQKTIQEKQAEIEIHKASLGQTLQTMREAEQTNLTELLVRTSKLSDYFDTVKSIDDAQHSLRANIVALKTLKADLEARQESLEQKRIELQQLKALQQSQQVSLNSNKSVKDKLLKQTKGEESKYQSLVKETQAQINRIQEQITSLQSGGLSVEDVIKYGVFAAKSVGIRPAFLIGIAEVESRLGKNVGTGTWRKDMYECYLKLAAANPSRRAHYTKRAEDEKAAFMKITSGLGLDPDSVKVSAAPSYGCGGAMGLAQFIPTTWAGYADKVAQITGHNPPSPWNVQDAFTAAAIKLAKDGATQGKAGEIRAAKAYLSGNGNCTSSICNYYANLALEKAAIIEQNLAQ